MTSSDLSLTDSCVERDLQRLHRVFDSIVLSPLVTLSYVEGLRWYCAVSFPDLPLPLLSSPYLPSPYPILKAYRPIIEMLQGTLGADKQKEKQAFSLAL